MAYGMKNPVTMSKGRWQGDILPNKHKLMQMQNFTPEQMQLMGQGMQNVGPDSYLSRLAGGDQSTFDEMESPAMQQFSSQMGGLASRFSGMGMGGRRSSGFQNSATSASSNFAQQLQSNRQNLMRQAQQDLHGMSTDLMGQRPFQRNVFGKQQNSSGWGGALGALGGGALGFFAGGPAGALKGAATGYGIGSQF